MKDTSSNIKLGDAFSLRDVASGQYMSVHIGAYGGILKLAEVKKN